MKALVFKGIGKIALEEVKDPKIKDQSDALIKDGPLISRIYYS